MATSALSKPASDVRPVQTVLVIVAGLLALHLWWGGAVWLYGALGLAVLGGLSLWAARKIDWAWMKLAWLLGLVVPKIMLGAVFYLLLTPLALLRRLTTGAKDEGQAERQSTFVVPDVSFDRKRFEKPW
jgi:hypothetical protein